MTAKITPDRYTRRFNLASFPDDTITGIGDGEAMHRELIRCVKGTLWERVNEVPLPLDPEPWVAWGVRYPTRRGSTYFEPRPLYSQNRSDYPEEA